MDRQVKVRSLYLAQADLLKRSDDPADQLLGGKVKAFVESMPVPDSERLALARELRAANSTLAHQRPDDGRDRDR